LGKKSPKRATKYSTEWDGENHMVTSDVPVQLAEDERSDKSPPGGTAERISVVLVDDHALVRRGLRRLLEDCPDIYVVGEASDGVAAVNMAQELKPRIVIMDCALPALSGLMAAKAICETLPGTHVLMLSMYAENTWVHKALKFGARGYILKNAVNLDLAIAVQRLAAGEIVLDPQLSRPRALKGERSHGLTARELQVVQHIVAGRSNKDIAIHLDISVNTVGVHRSNIMQMLNIHNAAELASYAVRNGLLNIL
jgi:NarL family two-component system response regulator LiaR